jgi:hypothetical protein
VSLSLALLATIGFAPWYYGLKNIKWLFGILVVVFTFIIGVYIWSLVVMATNQLNSIFSRLGIQNPNLNLHELPKRLLRNEEVVEEVCSSVARQDSEVRDSGVSAEGQPNNSRTPPYLIPARRKNKRRH